MTGGESGKPKRLLSAFSQRVSIHVPSPPSRWAGRYGPFNVRAAGQVTSEKYNFPPHNPTREGSPEGRTSSLWGSFPHFFPRNGAPAGQAKVPCRSNGVGKNLRTRPARESPVPTAPEKTRTPRPKTTPNRTTGLVPAPQRKPHSHGPRPPAVVSYTAENTKEAIPWRSVRSSERNGPPRG